MKSYEVLCKTCGGTGYIMPANFTGETTSTPKTEICPVCKGSKTQMVHETSNGITCDTLSFEDYQKSPGFEMIF